MITIQEAEQFAEKARHLAVEIGYPSVIRDDSVRGFMCFGNANLPERLLMTLRTNKVWLDYCLGGVSLSSKMIPYHPEDFYVMRDRFAKYVEACAEVKNNLK